MRISRIPRIIFPLLGCVFLLSLNCTIQAGNEDKENLRKKITEIINYGSLAPSTHNAQMWKIKIVAGNKIRVLMDQQHILPQIDPENRESLISSGTFIENMVEAAPYFDLQPEVRILAQNPNDDEIAELTFYPELDESRSNRLSENSMKIEQAQEVDPGRAQFNFHTKTGLSLPIDGLNNIKNRHTIRIPYLRQKLQAQDEKWFKTFGTGLQYFPLSNMEGKYIQDAIIQATKKQVTEDNKQKELAGLFRFSKKEAEQEKDGLTPAAMGLTGIAKWFVSTFFTHDTVMSKSFRNQTVAITKKQAENCSGFVLITADDNSVTSCVNSGRSLERFLIMAAGQKLAVQPMSAPLEESPWKEEISRKVGTAKTVQMILRVGYVKDYGHPVSMRREVSIIQ